MVITIVSDITFYLLHASSQITPSNMHNLLGARPDILIVETSCLTDFTRQNTYDELVNILCNAHNACKKTVLVHNDKKININNIITYFDEIVTTEWKELSIYDLVKVCDTLFVYNQIYQHMFSLWHYKIDLGICVSMVLNCLYQGHYVENISSIDKAQSIMSREVLHNVQ